MTKMFGNLKADGLEEAVDRVGGARELVPTGVYAAKITMAYAGQSSGGANFVQLHLDVNGNEVRETIYVTNKKGENFYADKNDASKKMPLPGFTLIDDICLFATEEGLAEQDAATKTVMIYDFDARKEVPTEVPVLVGLLDKTIKIALLRRIEDKQKLDGGVYVDTGETRTIHAIEKALHPETSRTVNEYRHDIKTPEYHDAFVKRWIDEDGRGKDDNRAKGKTAAGAGASGSGRPGAAAGAATPKKKLFGG